MLMLTLGDGGFERGRRRLGLSGGGLLFLAGWLFLGRRGEGLGCLFGRGRSSLRGCGLGLWCGSLGRRGR